MRKQINDKLLIPKNWAKEITESPVGHGGRPPNQRRVLINHRQRRSSGEEVKVDHTTNNLIRQRISSVKHVHPITVQQQNAVRRGGAAAVPQIHVHRVRPVQIRIEINGRYVGSVESVRIVGVELDPFGLSVLPQTVQRSILGQLRRDLDVLVFEHEIAVRVGILGPRVENDVAGGFPSYGEAERVGFVREDQLASASGVLCFLRIASRHTNCLF